MNSESNSRNPLLHSILLLFKGMLTGIAGILPGFSGGVMMLVFGVYETLVETIAHPFRYLKKNIAILVPFVLGIGVGFLLGAKLLADIFERYELQATCVFIGLIAGMVPALFRDAGSNGRKRGDWLGLYISMAVPLAILLFLKTTSNIEVTPNYGWYLFAGVLWGISLIAPGMSSSSLLMYLGLYVPLTKGLADLDFGVAIPWAAGIIVTILILSRLVNYIFQKYYSIALNCVTGVIIATTVAIIPLNYTSIGQGLLCLVLAVAGFFAAMGIDVINTRLSMNEKQMNN